MYVCSCPVLTLCEYERWTSCSRSWPYTNKVLEILLAYSTTSQYESQKTTPKSVTEIWSVKGVFRFWSAHHVKLISLIFDRPLRSTCLPTMHCHFVFVTKEKWIWHGKSSLFGKDFLPLFQNKWTQILAQKHFNMASAGSTSKSEFLVNLKYRLVRKIGSGSFGDIYLGINIQSGEVRNTFWLNCCHIKMDTVRHGFLQLMYCWHIRQQSAQFSEF